MKGGSFMKLESISIRLKLFLAAVVCVVIAGCGTIGLDAIFFSEDFSGYKAGDPLVKEGGPWLEMFALGGATAIMEAGDTGNVLAVDAFDSKNVEKNYCFQTTKELPDNFILETSFKVTRPGGWPQLQISATGTLNGNGPVFNYLGQPADAPTINFSYPTPTPQNAKESLVCDLDDNEWHTVVFTGYGDVYTLYFDGVKFGVIDTVKENNKHIYPGTVQLRVQSMIAYFDYFRISEFDGTPPFSGTTDPDDPDTGDTGPDFTEDFKDYAVGDSLVKNGAKWVTKSKGHEAIALVLTAGDGASSTTGKMLMVDAYVAQSAGNAPYNDKALVFYTSRQTPDNFKLETRFKIIRTGGYPQLQISPKQTVDGGGPFFYWIGGGTPQIRFVHPAYNRPRATLAKNFVDNNWHSMVLTGFGNVYTLYVDGSLIGEIDTMNPSFPANEQMVVKPGAVELRVQSMEAHFDYFKVSEWDGQ
jgi:hypothetical protein